MTVTYCERWFRHKKKPIALINESDARICHENRRLYTVVQGDLKAPECFIEINNDYVGVGFLDTLLREYLSYSFQEKKPGKLFLTMVTHRIFDGQTDSLSSGTTYYFTEDGTVTIEIEDFVADSKNEKLVHADVSGNWEEYPKFGQYSSISEVNRKGTTPIS
jgi:hypothetical protein